MSCAEIHRALVVGTDCSLDHGHQGMFSGQVQWVARYFPRRCGSTARNLDACDLAGRQIADLTVVVRVPAMMSQVLGKSRVDLR